MSQFMRILLFQLSMRGCDQRDRMPGKSWRELAAMDVMWSRG